MSLWVRAFCRRSVASATPDALREGIGRRWRPIIFLLSPDDEEEPDAVLARLRIDDDPAGKAFRHYEIHHHADGSRFIRVERWAGEASRQEVEEARDQLDGHRGFEVAEVLAVLDDCVETVGLEVSLSDAQGMGLPVAVAAAVWFAEHGDGVVHVEGYGWMAPEGNAARLLLDD